MEGDSKNNLFRHFNIQNLKLSVDLNNFLADDREDIIKIRKEYFYKQYEKKLENYSRNNLKKNASESPVPILTFWIK